MSTPLAPAHESHRPQNFTGPLLILARFVSVAATLRYAQEFFLPLVLAALMLAQALACSGVAATVFSSQLLAGESVEQAVALAPSIVCISSLPPVSTIAARALCKRLRARLPSARIVIGLW